MSKANKKVYEAKTSYPDRSRAEQYSFPELSVVIKTLDTVLLLLDSAEEPVLITVFNHITEFARKQSTNVEELKKHNMLELLLAKNFYSDAESVLIRRFALYIITAIFDNSELQEFETVLTARILDVSANFFLTDFDDFCIEYLTYIVNMCLRDPQAAQNILESTDFLHKFKCVLNGTENPDTVLNSIEALHKMLQVQNAEEILVFSTMPDFPIDRVLCEVTNEFPEIRLAALKLVKILLADTGNESTFASQGRCIYVLQQLTKSFCDNMEDPEAIEIVDVLAAALRSEKMTKLFFEQNLFDKIIATLGEDIDTFPMETMCSIIAIFAETAKYPQYLSRLHAAGLTEMFLKCLMNNEPAPATHVLLGLNRMESFADAQRAMVAAYNLGMVNKLIKLFCLPEIGIKTREQAAELLGRLLVSAFHSTAKELFDLDIANVLANTFQQGLPVLSIDLILSMLAIIEHLSQNDEYRESLAQTDALTESIAQLLMKSFAHSILVNNIFRCLCTLIDEESVRRVLLDNFIVSSIKRALRSLSNLVKTAVTNFILQTTRFNEFIDAYIDRGILEVLMLYQKHAFCVSTWGPAIESILSKCPTMKFCIRNHLGFTDITAGKDFYISKHKFEDFRDFQTILNNDCSPLEPIFVINFDRGKPTSEDLVNIPSAVLEANETVGEDEWCYCKRPGDEFLPLYLEALNGTLASYGLVENPEKIRRCIDFENVAKRAKIIAESVASVLNADLNILDLNSTEECSRHTVKCHLMELRTEYHTNYLPLGAVRSGCQFERAILFKCLADQIGLPSTLQRSVDGRILYNEVPLPVEIDQDIHCDKKTMKFMPWRMLRPTHIVDLMYNVGELYPMQSRQALQYLRLY